MDQYVVWAFILGGLSAISLLIGSLVGVSFKIPKSVTGLMAVPALAPCYRRLRSNW